MKAQRRWMRSVIAAAALPQPALPFARNARPARAGNGARAPLAAASQTHRAIAATAR